MEFSDELSADQRIQKQHTFDNYCYKSQFDRQIKRTWKMNVTAKGQQFLATKEEEEKQKKVEARKEPEKFIVRRDSEIFQNIQKSSKVSNLASQSAPQGALDRNTFKIIEKYGKAPEVPIIPKKSNAASSFDLDSINETLKNTLPHVVIRKLENIPDIKNPKHTERKMPKRINIRQLSKPPQPNKSIYCYLPIRPAVIKRETEPEPGRLMTMKQKTECGEEMKQCKRGQENFIKCPVPRKVRVVDTHDVETERSVYNNKNCKSLLHNEHSVIPSQSLTMLEKEKAILDKEKMQFKSIRYERDQEGINDERLKEFEERMEREMACLREEIYKMGSKIQTTHQTCQTDEETLINVSGNDGSSEGIGIIQGPTSHSEPIITEKILQGNCSFDNKLPQTKSKMHEDGSGYGAETKLLKPSIVVLQKKTRLVAYSDSDGDSEGSNI